MDVTIVIILHNRHQNIQRLVNYYDRSEVSIILADSSTDKHPTQNLPGHWQHVYTPGISYTQKIEKILPQVKTKYVILCADDDFIIPSSLPQCVNFLEAHPDYAAVQGHSLCYKKSEVVARDIISFYPLYYDVNYSYEQADPLVRLDAILANYKSFLYAVHRTERLAYAYNGASKHIHNLYLNEYTASLLPLVSGKYKELDLLYQVREYAADSDDKTATNINKIVKEDQYKNDLDAFIFFLVKKINGQLSFGADEIQTSRILTGLKRLANSIDANASQKPTLKKKLGSIIAYIPFFGSKLIAKSRKSELAKQLARFITTDEDRAALSKIRSILADHSERN
ncbi:TIGR00180 family glycosyltransferase [Niabella insulamsoli]|uniref:TIGR00180 family glycosyltransferase n=1 Tax=Niabella insulamsoli TaxID=3144874 RepID=UPI0031FDE43D